jgi:hypothetical protein
MGLDQRVDPIDMLDYPSDQIYRVLAETGIGILRRHLLDPRYPLGQDARRVDSLEIGLEKNLKRAPSGLAPGGHVRR